MKVGLELLQSHVRKQLAQALRSGGLKPPYHKFSVMSFVSEADPQSIVELLCRLESSGLTPEGIAFGLDCFEKGVFLTPTPELAWTGPEVTGLHARSTRKVYEELFESATESLWISTYAFFDGPKAFQLLAKRMDETPELKVSLILNIQRKWGVTTPAEILVSQFAKQFWEKDWPGDRRPNVYYDKRSLGTDALKGVLHAKAVVQDQKHCFITSANLTEAAWDKNVEIGVMLRDQSISKSLIKYFQRLIEDEWLVPLVDPHN